MSKPTERENRSEIAGLIHELMSDDHDAGMVSRAILRDNDDADPNRAYVFAAARASAAAKAKTGANAARGQDFLYGEDGLPD